MLQYHNLNMSLLVISTERQWRGGAHAAEVQCLVERSAGFKKRSGVRQFSAAFQLSSVPLIHPPAF
jgi:hypothetical protein